LGFSLDNFLEGVSPTYIQLYERRLKDFCAVSKLKLTVMEDRIGKSVVYLYEISRNSYKNFLKVLSNF
jgi:hypothetical protein